MLWLADLLNARKGNSLNTLIHWASGQNSYFTRKTNRAEQCGLVVHRLLTKETNILFLVTLVGNHKLSQDVSIKFRIFKVNNNIWLSSFIFLFLINKPINRRWEQWVVPPDRGAGRRCGLPRGSLWPKPRSKLLLWAQSSSQISLIFQITFLVH